MTDEPGDILDELFPACALAAFIRVARECGGWPPSEQVKQLANRIYEDNLAARPRRDPAE